MVVMSLCELEKRGRKLKTRYFSEVGLARGSWHLLRSTIRHRKRDALRRHWADTISSLDTIEPARILRKQGFAKLRHQDTDLTREVLDFARTLQAEFSQTSIEEVKEAKQGQPNPFFYNIYEGKNGDPFRRFATSRYIVEIASRYFGEVPILQDIEYHISPVNDPSQYSGSQNWHKDIDQPSKLKLFFNTHAMTLAHGPTFVFGRKYQALRYAPNYPMTFSDEEARAAGINLADAIPLTGETGTFHFVDTGELLHCGSRKVERERFLLVMTFGPRRSRLAKENERRCITPTYFAQENAAIEALFQPRENEAGQFR